VLISPFYTYSFDLSLADNNIIYYVIYSINIALSLIVFITCLLIKRKNIKKLNIMN